MGVSLLRVAGDQFVDPPRERDRVGNGRAFGDYGLLIQQAGGQKRVLELNPTNAAVEALRDLHLKDSTDPRLDGYARLLYEQAVIAEGSPITDPVAFARRVNELIARDTK